MYASPIVLNSVILKPKSTQPITAKHKRESMNVIVKWSRSFAEVINVSLSEGFYGVGVVRLQILVSDAA